VNIADYTRRLGEYAGRNQRETLAERTGHNADSERYSIPSLENPKKQIEMLKAELPHEKIS